jgi:hypothetical protein
MIAYEQCRLSSMVYESRLRHIHNRLRHKRSHLSHIRHCPSFSVRDGAEVETAAAVAEA